MTSQVEVPPLTGLIHFISGKRRVNIAEHETFSTNKYENANYIWHFHIYKQRKFHAQLSWAWKKFYNLKARTISCNNVKINIKKIAFGNKEHITD